MRGLGALLIVMVSAMLGCSLVGVEDAPPDRSFPTRDGLERVDVPIDGVLELRKDHRIGGYDALMIPNASISYEEGSSRLTTPARRVFLELLRDSIVTATAAAAIPVEQQPGPCVMEINLSVSRLDLDVAARADQLAELTVIMQFRDSGSRTPLLRYSNEARVPNPETGITRDEQLRTGLDKIVADLNLAGVLRPAGLADDELIPGCKGTLAARGRAAQQR